MLNFDPRRSVTQSVRIRPVVAATAIVAAVTLASCAAAPPTTEAHPAPPAPANPPTGDVTLPWTTVHSGDADGFDITLRFSATMPADHLDAVIAAFRAAATRWEQVITADLAPVTYIGFNGCWGSGPTGTIDDVTIDVTIAAVDGPGGVLGAAGYCRKDGTIPRAGAMKFDSADLVAMLQLGNFDRVAIHEMGHVLGIGTAWAPAGLLDTSNGSDPRFTGPNAVAEWNAMTGGSDAGVPVEATGGSGTALAHWREATFRSELMTGWIAAGASPLSRLSIAALADLGYTVDVATADPYVLGPSILDLIAGNPSVLHSDDVEHGRFVLFGPDGPIGTD